MSIGSGETTFLHASSRDRRQKKIESEKELYTQMNGYKEEQEAATSETARKRNRVESSGTESSKAIN